MEGRCLNSLLHGNKGAGPFFCTISKWLTEHFDYDHCRFWVFDSMAKVMAVDWFQNNIFGTYFTNNLSRIYWHCAFFLGKELSLLIWNDKMRVDVTCDEFISKLCHSIKIIYLLI